MDFRPLEYLIELDETKNFTFAAEKLYVTHGTLVHFVAKLEEEAGAPLFIKANGKLTPTKVGTLYINMAKKMLASYHDYMNEIAETVGKNTEQFSVAASSLFADNEFHELFNEFGKTFPNVDIEIQLTASDQEICDSVLRCQADLGITNNNCHLILNSDDGGVAFLKVASEPLLFVVPRDMDLPEEVLRDTDAPIDIKLFNDKQFYVPGYLEFEAFYAAIGYVPKHVRQTTTAITAFNFVKSGKGVGIIRPSSIIDRGAVHCFRVLPECYGDYYIVYRKNAYLTKAEKHFIKLRKYFFSKQNEWAEPGKSVF